MSNNISELKVLRSAAGYYIGRTQDGMPYSRVSTYFRTSEEAEELLHNPHWEHYARNTTNINI